METFAYNPDATLYYFAFDRSTGYVYVSNGASSGAFADASWDTYEVAMTERGTSSGIYELAKSSGLDADGYYDIVIYEQAGGSPAITDQPVGAGTLGTPPSSVTLSAGDIEDIVDGIVGGGVATLANQTIILARVNAARVVYSGPVSSTLSATIIQGDDYLDADGEALSWTIEDYTGPSVTSSTAALKVMTYADYIAEGGTVALSVTATAAMVGDDLVLKADLTAAQTAALEASPPDDKWNYVYQVIVTLSNGHVITPARATGAMTVQKRIG